MTWTAFKKGIEFLEKAFNISPKLERTEMASMFHALKHNIKGDDHWLFLVGKLRDTTERWNPRWEGYNPVAAFLRLYKEYPYTPSPAAKKEAEADQLKKLQELKRKRNLDEKASD